jgi:hypothetical protein
MFGGLRSRGIGWLAGILPVPTRQFGKTDRGGSVHTKGDYLRLGLFRVVIRQVHFHDYNRQISGFVRFFSVGTTPTSARLRLEWHDIHRCRRRPDHPELVDHRAHTRGILFQTKGVLERTGVPLGMRVTLPVRSRRDTKSKTPSERTR